ncbi:unnamed protein product [Camellia sinensis]
MRISSSTPIRMKNLVYDLKFVLAECVMAGDFPEFDETSIRGFEHHFEKIKDLLLKTPDTDSISTIGIVGMGGSVVFAILKSLASDFSWCGSAFDLNELLHNLHCRLLNNKYLIVLDNVWHASNWYFDLDSNSKLQMEGNENYTRLSHGLPRGSGGAIIVTSRLNEVASKMVGKRNLYPLEPTLDTESCWSIVIDSIEKGISDHWILEKIKDDMVDSAIKEFHLEFENSVAPTSEVLKEIRSCPGASPTELLSVFDFAEVYYAKIARDHDNKVEAGGNFNPQDVVNALRKFSLGEIKINGIEPLQKQWWKKKVMEPMEKESGEEQTMDLKEEDRTKSAVNGNQVKLLSLSKLLLTERFSIKEREFVLRTTFEMDADHLQFLKNKFISDFEEAEGEEFVEFPLWLHFVEISEFLHQKRIDLWTPIGLKDPLYDLKFALADCVMLAEKERDRITKNKKSLLLSSHHYVKKQWSLFKMKRKLLRIKNELLQNMSDVDVADIADERLLSSSLIRVCRPTDFPDFNLTLIHGFNNHLQKMEALLLTTTSDNDNFSAIGIVGMGGSGKTTLAQMVFHGSRVQESFSPLSWVELPQYPDLRSIVLAILECLASDFSSFGNTSDLDDLLRNLDIYLFNKKHLIKLDNMWPALSDDLDFNKYVTPLWNGFPRGSGGAIIITSRLKEVASEMVGELNLYELEPILDRESCWRIILDSIRKKYLYHQILRKMKDDMVDSVVDPTAIKMFRLVFDKPVAPTSELLKKLRTYSGVYFAEIVSDHNNEVEAGGSCDPEKVVED